MSFQVGDTVVVTEKVKNCIYSCNEEMKEMIAEQLNCEESSITETTSFKDDLGADSLDLFELVMALEEKYEVEIPSEELAELTTVGAVMEYLKNKGVEA